MLPVPLQLLTGVGSMRINVPEDLRPLENRRAALNTLRVNHAWDLYITPVPYVTVARCCWACDIVSTKSDCVRNKRSGHSCRDYVVPPCM